MECTITFFRMSMNGQEMKERVEEQIKKTGLPATDENIRKVVFWNRKAKGEHSCSEVREYLTAKE